MTVPFEETNQFWCIKYQTYTDKTWRVAQRQILDSFWQPMLFENVVSANGRVKESRTKKNEKCLDE